ncbi:YkvA family protein [Kaistella sp.]|uniref:YkvA family protein n=1 Tax=Kaistella sp. TaxID=2782235 RepID=UPI003C67DCC8
MKIKISKIQLAKEAFKHKGFIAKLPVIIRMIKSTMKKGGYKPQFKDIILPGLVLLYVISPIDIIPDWIPGIGVLDDLALLAFAIPLLVKEAEKFIAWEASNKSDDPMIEEAEVIG